MIGGFTSETNNILKHHTILSLVPALWKTSKRIVNVIANECNLPMKSGERYLGEQPIQCNLIFIADAAAELIITPWTQSRPR